MTKHRTTPILLTLIAFIANTVSSSAHAYETIYFPNEASPEEIAAEFAEDMGLAVPPESSVEVAPQSRVIPPSDFGQYRLSVDIFRRSTKRPVLGSWNDDYVDPTNSTFTSKVEKTRLAQGKKRFAALAGLEFAVVSIDGVPVKAHIISGAREAEVNLPVRENGRDKLEIARDEVTGEVLLDPTTGRPVVRKVMKLSKKTTPNGAFKISPRYGWKVPYGMPAKSSKVKMVDPFPLSSAYELSTMYWGLEIFGGYLIHSTPHYGELGRPASMGCIRQSYPDAMELFDMVTNQFGGVGMIRIHKMDSVAAYNRLRELVYDPTYEPVYTASQLADPATMPVYASASAPRDMKWLVERLNNNFQNLKDFIRYNRSGEYTDYGHTWLNPVTKQPEEPVFPKCGDYDCFVEYGNPTQRRWEKVQKKREADAQIEEAETQRLLQQSGF